MASSSLPGKLGPSDLHRAAFFGNLDFIKQYGKEIEKMSKGESVGKHIEKFKDENGNSALHIAALGGATQVCDYLIKQLNVHTELTNLQGTTPLFEAIIIGHILTAIFLLENGANPNVTCKMGFTPLHIAAKKPGSQELIQLLISKGAQINAKQAAYGFTPLYVAASVGQKDAVKILLLNHADPNPDLNHNMFSPLGAAINGRSVECVKLLLEAGANPDKELERAVLVMETEIIKCLLAAGANPNARNDIDLTALEVAAIKGFHECVQILFPVTAPVAGVKEWSISGIMKYGQTEEAKSKIKEKNKKEFLVSKSLGEAAVRRNDYVEAAGCYTACLNIEPREATILSNRSLCWAKFNLGDLALSDAQACISLRPDWSKAYYREGVAWNLLGDLNKAADSFLKAWQLDKENEELKSIYYKALDTQRRSNK